MQLPCVHHLPLRFPCPQLWLNKSVTTQAHSYSSFHQLGASDLLHSLHRPPFIHRQRLLSLAFPLLLSLG